MGEALALALLGVVGYLFLRSQGTVAPVVVPTVPAPPTGGTFVQPTAGGVIAPPTNTSTLQALLASGGTPPPLPAGMPQTVPAVPIAGYTPPTSSGRPAPPAPPTGRTSTPGPIPVGFPTSVPAVPDKG